MDPGTTNRRLPHRADSSRQPAAPRLEKLLVTAIITRQPVHLVCARDLAEVVLLAELSSAIRARQLHIDGIAANAATADGGALDRVSCMKSLVKKLTQVMVDLQPTPAIDNDAQQRIVQLETHIAQLKHQEQQQASPSEKPQLTVIDMLANSAAQPALTPTPADSPDAPPDHSNLPARTGSFRARSSTSKWDPKCLLDPPSQRSQWVIHNYAGTTNETQFKQFIKNLKMPANKRKQLQTMIEQVTAWTPNITEEETGQLEANAILWGFPSETLGKTLPAVLHKLLATAYLFGN